MQSERWFQNMWGELLSMRVVRLCTQLILCLTNFKYLALNIDLQDTYYIKYASFVSLSQESDTCNILSISGEKALDWESSLQPFKCHSARDGNVMFLLFFFYCLCSPRTATLARQSWTFYYFISWVALQHPNLCLAFEPFIVDICAFSKKHIQD